MSASLLLPLVSRVRALPWPLPAVLAWTGGWAAWFVAAHAGAGQGAALGLALIVSVTLALCSPGRRRQAIAAAGFPLSALALGMAAGVPSWAWLALLLPVLAAYPMRAWRDAPFFPTPPSALAGLDSHIERPARILDAGCGLGHGLRALRAVWPQAQLSGIEWSAPLALTASWRCRRWAQVRRGDMWAASWAGFDLVYLFQRPESMGRAWAKAVGELAPGAWLASLEFEVPGVAPHAVLRGEGRPVWLYCVPGCVAANARPSAANSASTDTA